MDDCFFDLKGREERQKKKQLEGAWGGLLSLVF